MTDHCPNCGNTNNLDYLDGAMICPACGGNGMSEQITCPSCKSTKWSCYDEGYEDFEDIASGEIFEMPVGYLKCTDCNNAFTHYDADASVKHLGRWDDDREGYA